MKLGLMFGISSMAAAGLFFAQCYLLSDCFAILFFDKPNPPHKGLGNTLSDVVGISLGNSIEAFAEKLGSVM